MKTKQINDYIKNQNFGLKDYHNTYDKWKNYKEDKTEEFFKQHEEAIKDYLEELDFLIENGLFSGLNQYGYNLYIEIGKNPTKRDIKAFKTYLNNWTFEKNKGFIKDLKDLNNEATNENELRALSIILYLRNYFQINQQMKTAFENLLLIEEEE